MYILHTVEELFPIKEQRSFFNDLFDLNKMYQHSSVAEYIKHMMIKLEKQLVEDINENNLSNEDLVKMFVSLTAYMIKDMKDFLQTSQHEYRNL